MLTMKEAAAALDGNEYRREGSKELFAQMKVAGLVAVFGASDDLMEFRGAVDDEVGDVDAYFTKAGLLTNECRDHNCPHFAKKKEAASHVAAIWCPDGIETSWLMRTELPNEAFTIREDGETYCIGLVFSLADCAA